MSLYGRYLIDTLKRSISSRLTLPVPPYGSAAYWEGVYSKLGVTDVYEWADLDFREDLRSFRYSLKKEHIRIISDTYGEKKTVGQNTDNEEAVSREEEFDNAIGVHGNSGKEETILFLGCGNSTFGENVLQYYIDKRQNQPSIIVPKIVQCDISAKLVTMMTERYQPLISSKEMSVVQDDAASLTLFDDESIDAVLDKGLMDALFCANQHSQMNSIMKSVNRSMKVGKAFSFFSFSRPEFLLQDTLTEARDKSADTNMWKHVEVRELERIFLYQFVKGGHENGESGPKEPQQRSRKKWRRPIS